jgi:hypothetical protein
MFLAERRSCWGSWRHTMSSTRETIAFGLVLVVLMGVTFVSLASGPTWRPGGATQARWCRAGETPVFQFGFAELARQLGGVMGQPTECEHGDDWSSDTRQETTTGLAEYQWCTNTPSFTRGQEHWALQSNGLQHWIGDGGSPRPPPIVQEPDLRHPCAT